jgi:hypothetical protein
LTDVLAVTVVVACPPAGTVSRAGVNVNIPCGARDPPWFFTSAARSSVTGAVPVLV